jgi:cell division protein ZapA
MNEGAKRSVTVRIAGEDYTLRSEAPPEYTRKCAAFLDDRIREIRDHAGRAEGHRSIILAALAITDRYFSARFELDQLRQELAARAAQLAHQVEERLTPEELPLSEPDPPES